MRVFLTGGTGLIGRALIRGLIERGDEAVCITRDRRRALSRLPRPVEILEGDPAAEGAWQDALADCDAVINLAGEPLAAGRWTSRRKQQFRRSRLETTRRVVDAVHAHPRVRTLLSGSAVGYYAEGGREPLYEEREAGGDFLGRLAHEWEGCALEAASGDTRVVLLRTGVVLARDGDALARLTMPYRFGLGGPLGDPRAFFPWIHRSDMVRATLHLLDHEGISGPVNMVVPDPPTQQEFAQALGRVLGKPSAFRMPAFLLRLALGEMADMMLCSCRAVPKVLRANGFSFKHHDLEAALIDLLR
ncbi:MAG: TIGR01777 family oxidoreductase [Actinobacteria bacterium]|nr:TIGR01777 family oxidoreductase [bacterium]MBU1072671.1 TIGR01777 family oxidoreductase [bacterium]MBU1228270.1 TIGR01777 family oxidoreductase [Actinomycetota bacterium]MBU1675812.1 TIGR01777 family oxidoreductase [bacterium]